MDRQKIILDCDPGHDDAIAIMLAAKHPAIDLLGITVVAGNQTLDKTLPNALHICQTLELDVPVYAGMPLPLVRQQVVAANIHGESGLDGPVFEPLTRCEEKIGAVQFIIDTLMASDGDITLVPVGPLTNIAVAMRAQPAIVPKIKQIVLMGGAYGLGNTTPAAEFNIYADPEAAHVVFSSGVPLVMMGLDLTNQTACTMAVIERMEAIGNRAGKLFGDIMRFTHKTQHDAYGLDGGPVHDVTCVAYLIDPTIFTVQDMYAEVDITGGPSYGRTLCDYYHVYGDKAPNCKVGITLDQERFWDLVAESVEQYS
ncbi:ribosylpyrimidine nucleosidase [Neobittarella massiliensis]|uniref:Ribosylpyrimidine nucleosidase n=1 Tax=Neobittarella massiliensis (ex Bilen et al. 2018) TaxID=2041842 RepID=A0A8J6LYE1_9FIRM|nr:ribosylpyrimidine nucleosidase [Neobittarella massiliensis]MBC3515252.1 ribosylpyrimidine nucleosidase [Neobittarella massiliensis]